jgi:serine protease Do
MLYRRLLFVFVIMALVSMACSFSFGTTNEPKSDPATATVESVKVDVITAAPPTAAPQAEATQAPAADGAVATLDDVKQATIQIIAEGTFVSPQVGVVQNAAGSGTGFIIDPSGIAVTNNHVVTGAALLKVFIGGDTTRQYSARVLGVSECSDLAVIQIDGANFPYLTFVDQLPKVGTDVYAAGFPLGDPEFTLTRGIISKAQADGRTNWASINNVIEHDATINPGNSGGPLVDANGKVVGVNYAYSNSTNQYFSIAPSEAQPVIEQLRKGRDVASLGINGLAVRSEDGSLSGIWVSSVASGSPADKSGIKGGDIVTHLENLVLATDGTMSDYCSILRSHQPSDTLNVSVLRFSDMTVMEGQINGRELAVSMSFAQTLGSDVDDTGSASGAATYTKYVQVTDDSGSIMVEIPAEWAQIDGRPWQTTWGSFDIHAPSISAAADLDAYNNSWDESGVFFAASSDMGRTGGYMQLLEGVQDWYRKDCRLDSQANYEDDLYEGRYQLYKNCGPNKTYSLVLTARPKVNKTDFLILIDMRITNDADLEALDHILNTFVVQGDV